MAADLIWCADERAVRRQGQQRLRELPVEDQRAILRALRRGEAVADPRLDEESVAMARSMDVKCLWGTLFHTTWLGLIALGVVLRLQAEDWEAAAKALLAFDAFALAASIGPLSRQRARAAEHATRLRSRP